MERFVQTAFPPTTMFGFVNYNILYGWPIIGIWFGIIGTIGAGKGKYLVDNMALGAIVGSGLAVVTITVLRSR